MKLIYTGVNGPKVRFSKGVDIPSGKDFVKTGEEVVAHNDRVAKDLIRQGVCVDVDAAGEPEAEPAPKAAKPKKPAGKPGVE